MRSSIEDAIHPQQPTQAESLERMENGANPLQLLVEVLPNPEKTQQLHQLLHARNGGRRGLGSLPKRTWGVTTCEHRRTKTPPNRRVNTLVSGVV